MVIFGVIEISTHSYYWVNYVNGKVQNIIPCSGENNVMLVLFWLKDSDGEYLNSK